MRQLSASTLQHMSLDPVITPHACGADTLSNNSMLCVDRSVSFNHTRAWWSAETAAKTVPSLTALCVGNVHLVLQHPACAGHLHGQAAWCSSVQCTDIERQHSSAALTCLCRLCNLRLRWETMQPRAHAHRLREADHHLHAQAELGASASRRHFHHSMHISIVPGLVQHANTLQLDDRMTSPLCKSAALTCSRPCGQSTGSRRCSRHLHGNANSRVEFFYNHALDA